MTNDEIERRMREVLSPVDGDYAMDVDRGRTITPSIRAMLDEQIEACAKVCDDLATENDERMRDENDERFGVYAKKYWKAADGIRALRESNT